MEWMRPIVLWIHLAAGFTGLAVFWIPALTRKGGGAHRLWGRVFAYCTYLVSASALVAVAHRFWSAEGALDPQRHGFMFLLGCLALNALALMRQAVRVSQTRRDPAAIRTPFHLGLAAACIAGSVACLYLAYVNRQGPFLLFLFMGSIGFSVGGEILRYAYRAGRRAQDWFFAHMEATLGAGTAFHTAFAVFGLNRLFDLGDLGGWGLLPWIVPGVVGTAAQKLWERHYRRRFAQGAGRAAA